MASSKTMVAGMHLPIPGIGHVRADGKGSYAWVPVEFAPLSKVEGAEGRLFNRWEKK